MASLIQIFCKSFAFLCCDLLFPQILPHFHKEALEESTRLEHGKHTTNESRGKDPDKGDDDPRGEEAAGENVV